MGGSRAQGCPIKGCWREMSLTVQWSERIGGRNGLWKTKLANQEVGRALGRWDQPEQEPQRARGTRAETTQGQLGPSGKLHGLSEPYCPHPQSKVPEPLWVVRG